MRGSARRDRAGPPSSPARRRRRAAIVPAGDPNRARRRSGRVAKVKRFPDAIIARAVEGDARADETAQGVGERVAGRIEYRHMVEPGRVRAGGGSPPRLSEALRPISTVIAASGNEGRLRTVSLRHAEAENPDVEGERPFEIRRPSDAHVLYERRDRSVGWRSPYSLRSRRSFHFAPNQAATAARHRCVVSATRRPRCSAVRRSAGVGPYSGP